MLVVCAGTGACSDTTATPAPAPPTPTIEVLPPIPRDPAAVYAALLEDDPCTPLSGGTATRRIVRAETIPLHSFTPTSESEFVDRFYPEVLVLRDGIFEDFVAVGNDEAPLPALEITTDLELEVWSVGQSAEYLDAGPRKVDEMTERFRQQHDDTTGILQFSRVGFSEDGRQALVYITRWMGFLWGSGWFSLLEYDDEEGWREVAYGDCWIS